MRHYQASSDPDRVLLGVKIRSEQDLEVVRGWCKQNGLKAGKLRKIIRKARSAIRNPEIEEFVWLYPRGISDPPESLVRVQLEVCSDTTKEFYTQEAVKSDSVSGYTQAEIDDILQTIQFGSKLSDEELKLLKDVVTKNIKAFSRSKGDLGYTTLIEHEIDLVRVNPVKLKPYKLSFEEQKYAADYVQTLIKEGQIQPSKSPWSSPAFLVPKKVPGTFRMVVDYRKLNDATKPWSMPLPFMSDLQHQLGRAKYFAIMDITSGFYNVPMKEEHRQYTAFCLRNLGLFEWVVMPMGLKNAPATLTRLQEMIFPPIDWGSFLKTFIDDMCAFADSIKDLASHLDRILSRLIWAGLKLCPAKCEFGTDSVEFLGHVISNGQMTMSKRKTLAVERLLPPTDVKELQHVLGLLQYYRVFIPKFSHVARPMTRLLSKNLPYTWTPKCQESFEFLRKALCSYPVLTCYDPAKTLVLDTDYQKNAISAILGMRTPGQKREQVIEYASRTLNATEQRLSTTEGELLAIIFGLKRFSVYLRGRPEFVIRTDHRALTWIQTLNPTSGKLARWLYIVQAEYNFKIEHREGKSHLNADALSRAVASHLRDIPFLENDDSCM